MQASVCAEHPAGKLQLGKRTFDFDQVAIGTFEDKVCLSRPKCSPAVRELAPQQRALAAPACNVMHCLRTAEACTPAALPATVFADVHTHGVMAAHCGPNLCFRACVREYGNVLRHGMQASAGCHARQHCASAHNFHCLTPPQSLQTSGDGVVPVLGPPLGDGEDLNGTSIASPYSRPYPGQIHLPQGYDYDYDEPDCEYGLGVGHSFEAQAFFPRDASIKDVDYRHECITDYDEECNPRCDGLVINVSGDYCKRLSIDGYWENGKCDGGFTTVGPSSPTFKPAKYASKKNDNIKIEWKIPAKQVPKEVRGATPDLRNAVVAVDLTTACTGARSELYQCFSRSTEPLDVRYKARGQREDATRDCRAPSGTEAITIDERSPAYLKTTFTTHVH